MSRATEWAEINKTKRPRVFSLPGAEFKVTDDGTLFIATTPGYSYREAHVQKLIQWLREHFE